MPYRPMEKLGRPPTIAEVLIRRAERETDRLAFVFTEDGVSDRRLTYGELDARARAVSSLLIGRGLSRSRAILAMPPGLHFVWAFFGALYARSTAVPVALPRSFEPENDGERERLAKIVRDCRASAVLTVSALVPFFEAAFEKLLGRDAPAVLAVDDLDATDDKLFTRLRTRSGDVALLQYTSGSTGDPRGVTIRHENIMANQSMITEAFNHDDSAIVGGWLPHYHDMGLIGILLHPLYLGVPSIVMPPLSFAQRPHLWLQMIDRYRVTSSGGPSFAYEICARRVTDAQIANLDLSTWKVAFDGSEPVRFDAHRRFAERFAPARFSASAFVPCYGLAEATLFVTGGPKRGAFAERAMWLDPEALSEGRAIRTCAEDAIEVVSCGKGHRDQTLRIVDPEKRTLLPDGAIGEIWVKGPHVASGYHGKDQLSRETFYAMLGDEGPFLRTGDLGFIASSELFVTGRLKDLIIVMGKNHYPHDLEETFARALGYVPPRRIVIVEDARNGGGSLIAVIELAKEDAPPSDHEIRAARRALFAAHGLPVTDVIVLSAGTVPRTTSGKKQRSRLARMVHEGLFAVAAKESA